MVRREFLEVYQVLFLRFFPHSNRYVSLVCLCIYNRSFHCNTDSQRIQMLTFAIISQRVRETPR